MWLLLKSVGCCKSSIVWFLSCHFARRKHFCDCKYLRVASIFMGSGPCSCFGVQSWNLGSLALFASNLSWIQNLLKPFHLHLVGFIHNITRSFRQILPILQTMTTLWAFVEEASYIRLGMVGGKVQLALNGGCNNSQLHLARYVVWQPQNFGHYSVDLGFI